MATASSNIRVDENYENDSGIEDFDTQSETTTLASAVRDYRYENNRRYHAYKEGAYWGPNDEKANDALDILHHLFLITLDNKLQLAPIGPNPQKVLDVGTGTGIWAIDFADQHPSAEVIGTDLSPIQPGMVPSNCKFEIDDANDDWTYTPNSFDFIHTRSLLGCISDWPKFYGEVMKHLKPGGYFEQAEMSTILQSDDGTVTEDTVLAQSGPTFIEAGKRMGKSMTIVDDMKGYLIHAGFEDVHEFKYRWPVGPWCKDPKLKELGRWNRLHLTMSLEGYVMAMLTRIMGWNYEEVQAWLSLMMAAFKNRAYHSYNEMKVVYARKPSPKLTS